MTPELEHHVAELINRKLLDRLGLENAVDLLGLEGALKLVNALDKVPVKERVVYLPKDNSPDPYDWQKWYRPQPMWCESPSIPVGPMCGTTDNLTTLGKTP